MNLNNLKTKTKTKTKRIQAHPNSTESQSPNGVYGFTLKKKKKGFPDHSLMQLGLQSPEMEAAKVYKGVLYSTRSFFSVLGLGEY